MKMPRPIAITSSGEWRIAAGHSQGLRDDAVKVSVCVCVCGRVCVCVSVCILDMCMCSGIWETQDSSGQRATTTTASRFHSPQHLAVEEKSWPRKKWRLHRGASYVQFSYTRSH